MRARVAVLFFAFIPFIYLQECNGKISDETRISMSVVRITSKEDQLQTGAYSNIPGKLFILKTDDIDRRSAYLKRDVMSTYYGTERICLLKAHDGMSDSVYIKARTDDGSHIITLFTTRDFIRSAESEDLEPLPFGQEDEDDVAQLAGWTKSKWQITIPVTIQKDEDKTYIHVLLAPFMEECEKIDGHYDMKAGDLLIQSDRIIGFLKDINNDKGIIIFYRAVSIISTDHEYFDLGTNDESSTPPHDSFFNTCTTFKE